MKNEKLPIKIFKLQKVNKSYTEDNNVFEISKCPLNDQELHNRSKQLLDAFCLLFDVFEKRVSSSIPFVFVVKIHKDFDVKLCLGNIISLFRINGEKNILAFISSDKLIIKVKSAAQMSELGSRLCNYKKYDYAISCLETFLEFKPSILFDMERQVYKIKLIDFQDQKTNIAMQRLFEQNLAAHHITYKKILYASLLYFYRIEQVDQVVINLLTEKSSFGMIFSIEPMPKCVLSADYNSYVLSITQV